MLAQAAGDPVTALRLAFSIRALEQLESLLNLRSRPEEFSRSLDQYIQFTQEEISSLTEQVERERLLGRYAQVGGMTDTERLRAEYIEHLHLLQGIRDARDQWPAAVMIEKISTARRRVDELFSKALGRPQALVAQAEAYRWKKVMGEQARADTFSRDLLAYRASPRTYMLDKWLDVWDEVLPKITKYVLGFDRNQVEIRLNLERQAETIEGTLTAAEAGKQTE